MIPGSAHLHVATLPELDPVRVTDHQRRVTHMAASILLAYPTAERFEQFDTVGAGIAELPGDVRERLSAFVALAQSTGRQELERHYVDVFDMKRKCSMYLSYFLTGDTRKRGMALVRFKEAYRAAGFEVDQDELPDFLPVVLEFSALVEDESTAIASGLLGAHREGIEVLRAALTSIGSPYAGVVEAVCLTLGKITPATKDRYLQLITAGPPTEMVGVDAMGPLEPLDAGMPGDLDTPDPIGGGAGGGMAADALRTYVPFDRTDERH